MHSGGLARTKRDRLANRSDLLIDAPPLKIIIERKAYRDALKRSGQHLKVGIKPRTCLRDVFCSR